MKTIKWILIMQFLGLLFLIVPYDSSNPIYVDHWIPFHEFKNTSLERGTYFWMLFKKFQWVLVYCIIAFRKIDVYTEIILIFAAFEFVKIIEWALNYNDAWFSLAYIGDIGLSHLFIMFGLGIYFMLKWKKWKRER